MIQSNTIPTYNLSYLTDKVAKLNKRAAKLGVEGFVVSTSPAEPLIIRDELLGNIKRSIPQITVTITGNTPKIDGWDFVGTIDNLGDGQAIYNAIPGRGAGITSEVVLAAYRHSSCFHCGVNRVRKQSFVLAGTRSFTIVGRSCLKDYMGHASAAQLIAMAKFMATLIATGDESGYGNGGFRTPDTYDIQGIILRTLAEVKVYGYTSAKAAQAYNDKVDENESAYNGNHATAWKDTTVQRVKSSYFPTFGKNNPFKEWKQEIEKGADGRGIKVILGKRDVAKAEAIVEWAKAQPNGDFMTNVKTLLTVGVCRMKHMGYIVGLVAYYNNAHEPRPEYVEKVPSVHVGTIRDKIDAVGTVKLVRNCSSQWGTSLLVKIDTLEGNSISWFANGIMPDLSTGDMVTVKGTIKKHDDYNGFKTTVLTRVKIIAHVAKIAKVADTPARNTVFTR